MLDDVVKHGGSLSWSTNDYDWLGSGVYFWEQNHSRAWEWASESARRGRIENPAVIGAVIDLGHCLNLTDSKYIELLENEYELLCVDLESQGQSTPLNTGGRDKLVRKLDCAVVSHLHARIAELACRDFGFTLEPFDTVRGLFSEGDPIYPGAGFRRKTHVQVCVRNPNCIKGYFIPRATEGNWPIP